MRTIHRDIRSAWLGLGFALVGCSVSLEPRIQTDGPPPIDSQACTTIESCGASCQRCEAPNDRSEPTCDGTACGYSCKNELACTDNSCSRTRWQFDSMTIDDVLPRHPQNLSLTVRNRDGNPALAMDVALTNTSENGNVEFALPVCLSGSLDASTKTFSFRVYFDPPIEGSALYAQAFAPAPVTGAHLGTGVLDTNGWNSFSFPISMSSFDNVVTTITIQAGPFGFNYTGTIWFDDFKIL